MNLFNNLFSLSTTSVVLCGTFLIAFLGYAVGHVKIKGISLGTAGVFISALLAGYVSTLPVLRGVPVLESFYVESPEAAVMAEYGFVESTGLILFVTSIGFAAGPGFFRDLKNNAKSYVPLAIIMVLSGSIIASIFAMIPGIGSDFATGIMSGALTSTPAFSAAKQVADESGLVALGNAIAYPFGVVGAVLFVQLIPRLLNADMEKERELLQMANMKNEAPESREKGSYVFFDKYGLTAFALAAFLGVILGAITVPLTGAGYDGPCFSLGNTGGPLIAALLCGHFGHIGRLNLRVPANLSTILREFGLTLFLAGAGFEGGAELVSRVQESQYGVMLIVYGFAAGLLMTVTTLTIGLLFARKICGLSLFTALGSITGARTSTPALGALIDVTGTEEVAAPYASTYPVALIFIVIMTNLIGTFI